MSDTIFVTGGTGHLGHSMLPLLVEAGFCVRALTRHPERHAWLEQTGVQVVQGDVEDAACMRNAIEGCRYVIHAAGLFSFWGKPEQFNHTNLQGTRNVLQAALAAGVERVIHISTVVVVGKPQPGRQVDENHPLNPVEPYQRSKLEGERCALSFWQESNLPVIVLRPGAFYGPNGRYAFNRLFIEDPLKGLRLQVQGGRLVTFPVYTRDVAQSALLAIQRGTPGEIYNICGDTLTHHEANQIVSREAGIRAFRLNVPASLMIALARLWTALSEVTHVEPYFPINLRSYVFNNWRVSSEKARAALGFTPIPFAEGVRHTLAWYAQNGFWKPSRRYYANSHAKNG